MREFSNLFQQNFCISLIQDPRFRGRTKQRLGKAVPDSQERDCSFYSQFFFYFGSVAHYINLLLIKIYYAAILL